MKPIIVLFVLLPVFASAADVSAKWKGSVEFRAADGDNVVLPVSAELNQRGKSITGTMAKAQ
jgi:hypothetical protein